MKRDPLPHLYYPADVARALGKSEWWVKEQARNHRIPYTKPGRAYRFTAEQFAEILRLFTEEPTGPSAPRQPRPASARVLGVTPKLQRPAPSSRLRARPPRRSAHLNEQQDAA